jgi:hypothetical protein
MEGLRHNYMGVSVARSETKKEVGFCAMVVSWIIQVYFSLPFLLLHIFIRFLYLRFLLLSSESTSSYSSLMCCSPLLRVLFFISLLIVFLLFSFDPHSSSSFRIWYFRHIKMICLFVNFKRPLLEVFVPVGSLYNGESCTVGTFIICTHHQILLGRSNQGE